MKRKAKFIKPTRYLSFGFSIQKNRVYKAEIVDDGVRIALYKDFVFTVVKDNEVRFV